LKRKKD